MPPATKTHGSKGYTPKRWLNIRLRWGFRGKLQILKEKKNSKKKCLQSKKPSIYKLVGVNEEKSAKALNMKLIKNDDYQKYDRNGKGYNR